jgi:hypothetical protein
MLVLLGVLLGFVASVFANLVTPFVKPLWVKLSSLSQQGYQAQVRQQIKVLQGSTRPTQCSQGCCGERHLHRAVSVVVGHLRSATL